MSARPDPFRPLPPPPSTRSLVSRGRAAETAWREGVRMAQDRAGAVTAEAGRDKSADVLFAGWAARAGGPKLPAFPAPDAPAQGLAEAFVKLARTFAMTTDPARRRLLAHPLRALAVALDEILEAPARAAMARVARQLGEASDDDDDFSTGSEG